MNAALPPTTPPDLAMTDPALLLVLAVIAWGAYFVGRVMARG